MPFCMVSGYMNHIAAESFTLLLSAHLRKQVPSLQLAEVLIPGHASGGSCTMQSTSMSNSVNYALWWPVMIDAQAPAATPGGWTRRNRALDHSLGFSVVATQRTCSRTVRLALGLSCGKWAAGR